MQTARALTVSEANGRATIYLAALSSSLIALAFIGQDSQLDAPYLASSLIVLPVLAFVGLVTFLRLFQSSMEDIAYAHRIGCYEASTCRLPRSSSPTFLSVERPRVALPLPPPAPGGCPSPSPG